MAKRSKDSDEARTVQEQYDGQPHGRIQWKGTDVCMDVYCRCGVISHVDAEFAYHVRCPGCGVVYFCNGHIELIELDVMPGKHLVTGVYCRKETDG